jgi:hypothetical protein
VLKLDGDGVPQWQKAYTLVLPETRSAVFPTSAAASARRNCTEEMNYIVCSQSPFQGTISFDEQGG